MKFTQIVFILSAVAFTCFTSVFAAPSLQIRAKDSVPAHLRGKTTFYRAITGAEVSNVKANYPVGGSPKSHSDSGGDFSPQGKGGLYVFDNAAEAEWFGKCYSNTPKQKNAPFYIVTFSYTPDSKLRTKSFTKPDSEWEQLVKGSYNGQWHGYDIVEGPYSRTSAGKLVGAMDQTGKDMLWQGIFIGGNALKTLKVTNVKQMNGGVAKNCNVM